MIPSYANSTYRKFQGNKFSFPFNKMAYSFSADAVQYSTGDAYYLRSQAGTEGPVVIDADVTITGDLQVDQTLGVNGEIRSADDIISRDATAGRVALQLTGSPANPSVVFGDVTAPGQFCALNYDKGGNTMTLIGSNPQLSVLGGLSCAGNLGVTSGAITSNGGGVFWVGGSGKVALSGGGSGTTGSGAIQSTANDGTTITPLLLQPAGGSVSIPSLTIPSLGYLETPVSIGGTGYTQYSIAFCGNRFFWGQGKTNASGSYTAVPLQNFAGYTTTCALITPNAQSVEDSYYRVGYVANPATGSVTINIFNPDTSSGVTECLFTYLFIAPGV